MKRIPFLCAEAKDDRSQRDGTRFAWRRIERGVIAVAWALSTVKGMRQLSEWLEIHVHFQHSHFLSKRFKSHTSEMQESGIVTGLEVRGIVVWFPAVTIDGPTQPHIQCVTRLFSWGLEAVKTWSLRMLMLKRLRMSRATPTTPPPYVNIYDMPNCVFMYQAFWRVA